MGFFYFLMQRSLSPKFTNLTPGKFGLYAAVLVYCVGSFISNISLQYLSHVAPDARIMPLIGSAWPVMKAFNRVEMESFWLEILSRLFRTRNIAPHERATSAVDDASICYSHVGKFKGIPPCRVRLEEHVFLR
jgi:hypothetical protein